MVAVCLARADVLARRAAAHGLAVRRPRTGLVEAAAAVGMRRTRYLPLALAARVEGLTADDLAGAMRSGTLVRVYGARGTVMVVPAADAEVFTAGTAPVGEASLRAALPGAFRSRLDRAGVAASDALQTVIDAVRRALADGPRPRHEVARAVTAAVPEPLAPPCRGQCPGTHVEDSLFRLAGVCGAMRFDGDRDWLVAVAGRPPDREAARAELVRRYLRCYGPSTPAALAQWAGVAPADARRSLAALAGEVVDATVDGAPAGVLLANAVDRAPVPAEGLRVLPAFDAYLLDRDRATLVPARAAQQLVWRPAGNPGVVLVDGEPAAVWRAGGRGGLVVEPLGPAPPVDEELLRGELPRLASAMGGTWPTTATVAPSR